MANESMLAQQGLINGSLFSQSNWNDVAVYPGNGHEQHVYLTIFANNLSSLSFNASDPTITYGLAIAASLFDPDVLRQQIWCIYPLSGQYDVLARGLYYLLLVVSFFFRRHSWLGPAALGTAMVYAATSAVHLFALITQYRFGYPPGPLPWDKDNSHAFGDVDLFGITAILAAAGVMLAPILNWSTSVRTHESQAVIVYWGILIFAALTPAVIYQARWYRNDWIFNTIPSFASCPKGISPDCDFIINNQILDFESYNRCQCSDFCGLLSPSAPLRSSTNMVALLGRKIANKDLEKDAFWSLLKINLFALAFIILHGAVGILTCRSSQAGVRNALFRLLNKGAAGLQRTTLRKSQTFLAKFVAASFYIFAILGAFICPMVFVVTIVVNELLVNALPVSEHSDAVGAWSSWVAAAFVLLAGGVTRYHNAIMASLATSLKATGRLFGLGKRTQPPWQSTSKERPFLDRINLFLHHAFSLEVHIWSTIRFGAWSIKAGFTTFCEWWKHAERLSQLHSQELDALWVNIPGRPVCNCGICKLDTQDKRDNSAGDQSPNLNTDYQPVFSRMDTDEVPLIHHSPIYSRSTSNQSTFSTQRNQAPRLHAIPLEEINRPLMPMRQSHGSQGEIDFSGYGWISEGIPPGTIR